MNMLNGPRHPLRTRTPGPDEARSPSSRQRIQFAVLFGGLCLLVFVMVVVFELDPGEHPSPSVPFLPGGALSHRQFVSGLIASCCVGAVGVLTWGVVRRWTWAHHRTVRRLMKSVLIFAVFASGFSYFYVRQGVMNDHYAHRYDTFHYLLHPRYYAELDYQDLYACTVEALSRDVIPDDNPVRDLRTYDMTTAGDLRDQGLCPRQDFTPDRWERWERDLEVFTETPGAADILRLAIRDRGYNGTPPHAAISGFLADRIPLSVATHNLVPLLDILMISVMLYAVAVAFGWKIGLLFALSVFAIAADSPGIIGGSWFRYAWLATLTLGFAALRRGSYAMSGVFMALSALLNVFPVVFSVGIVIRGVVTCWQERRLVPCYRSFVLAALVTSFIGIGVGLLPARHVGNYSGWIANMAHHSSERFQAFGVGLKFPFIYRGANTRDSDQVTESVRRDLFHENRKVYYPLAITLIGLALALAVKTRDDVEAATILGFTLFFCLLGTVSYYFACASLVILGLHRRAGTAGGTLLLSLWFLTSLLAHWALYETHYYRFMYNTVLSFSWTVWLSALLFWLAAREGILGSFANLVAAPSRVGRGS
ncbi:hypothetical protein HKCCSP123_03850 [Rhodobacterales bacterium HKCCSP123]|nr:hypothetical protein [Rhodobacterales bacterium HKCCSP123]